MAGSDADFGVRRDDLLDESGAVESPPATTTENVEPAVDVDVDELEALPARLGVMDERRSPLPRLGRVARNVSDPEFVETIAGKPLCPVDEFQTTVTIDVADTEVVMLVGP